MQSFPNQLNGFAKFLINKKILNEEKLEAIQSEMRKTNNTLIQCLNQNEMLPASQLAEAIKDYFVLPFFNLDRFDIKHFPKNLLPAELIQKYCILPLYQYGQELWLAVADPTSLDINEINFIAGLRCTLIIVETNKLTKVINDIYNTHVSRDLANTALDLETFYTGENTPELSQLESESSPVVRYIHKILVDGINKKCSDVHFESYENVFRIRYRIDGLLYEIDSKSSKLASYFIARLKILANLDISEKRIPQDGRFKLVVKRNQTVNLRLNICPTLFGEKAVVRILESSDKKRFDLDQLGMNPTQLRTFKNALQHTQGMFLITGPTGSGKTNTLYTILSLLNESEVNICAVEDPVEIQLPGITQVNVNVKTGFTFATALRAFLRQDPDIIMVGEIRDLETAEIAIKAAQTGHLVLSTLHTNNAFETLARLNGMGVARFNVAQTLVLILAQRLVRCLCCHCKKEKKFPSSLLRDEGFDPDEISTLKLFVPIGCMYCHQGYQGRTGIFEALFVTPEIRNLLHHQETENELKEQPNKFGVLNLRKAGLEKVKQGITSLAEINRVIKQ